MGAAPDPVVYQLHGEGQGSVAGWVVAFDTAKLAANDPPAMWCSNPDNSVGPGGGAGVWMTNGGASLLEVRDRAILIAASRVSSDLLVAHRESFCR